MQKLYIYVLLLLGVFFLGIIPQKIAAQIVVGKKLEKNAALFYQQAKQMQTQKNYSSALLLIDQSIKLCIEQKDTALFIDNLSLQAAINMTLKNRQATLKSYLKIIDLFEKQNKKEDARTYLLQIALIYHDIENLEKANEYFNLFNVTDHDNIETRYVLYKYYGLNLSKNSEPEKAIEQFEKGYKLATDQNNTEKQAEFMFYLSQVYDERGDNDKVLDLYIDIYELQSNTSDPITNANNLNNLAYAYLKTGDYKNALAIFKQVSIEDEKLEGNNKNKITTLLNLGICYQNLGQNSDALETLLQASELAKQSKQHNKIAVIENLIALVYYHANDLYNAEVFSLQSIKNAQSAKTKQDCYNTYSIILQSLNDYEKALEYYKNYLSIRDSLLVEKRLDEQNQAEMQKELEKFEEDYKLKLADESVKDLAMKQMKLEAERQRQEFELLQKAKAVQELENERVKQSLLLAKQQHDALVNAQKINELEQLKKMQQLEIEQKKLREEEQKSEIELLENERQLQRLELDKQAEQKKRMQWVAGLFSIIFILIVIGMVITRRINKKLAARKKEIEQQNADLEQKNEEINAQKESLQEANVQIKDQNYALVQKQEEISAQNELIEKKNKSITDSIFYAKRIQKAIMPPPTIMADTLSEYFVLFRPRDIVSGDFYWVYQQDTKLIIVAADCTGHGVPGAFMSMLGISSLNEIVNTKVENAAQILNMLRDKVKTALRQTGKDGEAKDGMDVALCVYDKQQNTIDYAGANNPIYRIRDNEIQITKADKMPIGIHKQEKPSFTNHVFEVKESDQFYIFSDGYVDQFGGEHGRKFLSRNFQKLLLEINNKNMAQQKQILETTLDNWQGGTFEQLDDILVIGLKI